MLRVALRAVRLRLLLLGSVPATCNQAGVLSSLGPSSCPIHPSAWKGFSQKFGCPIVRQVLLWSSEAGEVPEPSSNPTLVGQSCCICQHPKSIERIESLRSLFHFRVLLGGGAHHAQIPEELVDVGLPPLVIEVHEATDGRTSCSVDQDVQPFILT